MSSKEKKLRRGPKERTFLYRQLSTILRERIEGGNYKPGDRIPSMDSLASEFSLNKATVRSALAELIDDGLIYSVPAQGTFVKEPPQQNPAAAPRGIMTIGIVSQVMMPNDSGPFHLQLVEDLRHEISQMQANLLIITVSPSCSTSEILKKITNAGLHSIICIGPFKSGVLAQISKLDIPSVLLDALEPGIGMDMIAIDNESGAYQAIEHLLKNNCKSIAIITGANDQPATEVRLRGANAALKNANIKATIVVGDYGIESGFAAMQSLLENSQPPSGVFCMNDEMAAGAIQAIQEHGKYKVPEDISIVGFDDTTLSNMLHPKLTTIRIPTGQMARLAVQHLQFQLDDHEHLPVNTTLATTLIERNSTSKL